MAKDVHGCSGMEQCSCATSDEKWGDWCVGTRRLIGVGMMEELDKNIGLVSDLGDWIDDGDTDWERRCRRGFGEDY